MPTGSRVLPQCRRQKVRLRAAGPSVSSLKTTPSKETTHKEANGGVTVAYQPQNTTVAVAVQAVQRPPVRCA